MRISDKLSMRPGPADFEALLLDEWKFSLLPVCIAAALQVHEPEDPSAFATCMTLLYQTEPAAGPAVRLQPVGLFQKLAADVTSRLLEEQRLQAALAWARCTYVASRAINHAWLDFLAILIRCGELAVARPAGHDLPASSPMPRHIFQYRPGGLPLPPAGARVSWRHENPTSDYRCFGDADASDDVLAGLGGRVGRAYRDAPTASRKAAIFALARLFRHGGVYADASEVCHAPLGLLVPPGCALVLPWSPGRPPVVWPQFLAARPGHPVVGQILRHVVRGTEWMQATGQSIDEWMIYGAGGFTMSILDAWCERGAWPEGARCRCWTKTITAPSSNARAATRPSPPSLRPRIRRRCRTSPRSASAPW